MSAALFDGQPDQRGIALCDVFRGLQNILSTLHVVWFLFYVLLQDGQGLLIPVASLLPGSELLFDRNSRPAGNFGVKITKRVVTVGQFSTIGCELRSSGDVGLECLQRLAQRVQTVRWITHFRQQIPKAKVCDMREEP